MLSASEGLSSGRLRPHDSLTRHSAPGTRLYDKAYAYKSWIDKI